MSNTKEKTRLIVLLLAYILFFDFAAAQSEETNAKPGTPPSTQSLDSAALENVLGMTAYHDGQFPLAAMHFKNTVITTRLIGDKPRLATALLNLGNAQSQLRDYAEAKLSYSESAKFATENGIPEIAAKAYCNLARNALVLNDPQYAETALKLASGQLENIEDLAVKAEQSLAIGHLWQIAGRNLPKEKNHFQAAFIALSTGNEVAEQLQRQDLLAWGYGYLGLLYQADKRLDEALTWFSRAEFSAQAANQPDILFRWQWQSGRIYNIQGKTDLALVAYKSAIDSYQPIRNALPKVSEDLQSDFNGDQLYLEYADLKLQASGLTTKELSEVIEIVETGKTLELEQYFRDDCVTAWLNKATKLESLPPTTAALYPIVLPNKVELLLKLPEGISRYTVPVERDEVKRKVSQLRKNLENRSVGDFLADSQDLYEILIRPLINDLRTRKIKTLVFIPDSNFRQIPLAALHDKERFLIEEFAVATTPGLTLTESEVAVSEDTPILIAGMSQPSLGFQPLPYVEREIQSIAEQFPVTVIQNQQFQINALRKRLLDNPYRVVHIASHGQFNRNVNDTFVVASDSKLDLNTLSGIMGVSRFKRDPIALLTLSACQTAAGDDQAALGLAGIALKAGVSSALASLWFINDSASADLVAEFYRQLKDKSHSKAQALREAQLALLKDERYEHPSYWAPFLIIGNWL